MTGRLVDLSEPGATLPDLIILDSNVIATLLEPTYQAQPRRELFHAAALMQALQRSGRQAILTPTAYGEVIHAAIKVMYVRVRVPQRAALAAHYGRPIGFSWLNLYKIDPTILQAQADVLEEWRERLLARNIVLLDPSELGPIPSGQRYDRELLDLVVRYGLDTSDATILLEAMRIGVHSLVSFDRDMQRAVADFDVYTWLS
jgi:predicted nucleic acid-binding protein